MCLHIFGRVAELFPRLGCVPRLQVRGQHKVMKQNTDNCWEVCFHTALLLPSWVLDRDWRQKAGQQRCNGNGRGFERAAPLRPNAL